MKWMRSELNHGHSLEWLHSKAFFTVRELWVVLGFCSTVITLESYVLTWYLPGIVADLSFQTAARILAAPVELALVVMKDISQNFPTKAR